MKHVLIALTLAFFASCSASKKSYADLLLMDGDYSSINVDFDSGKINCLETLMETASDDTTGPVHIHLVIDSVQLGSTKIAVQKSYTFLLDKESEMIEFADSVGVKLFHSESWKYGKVKHYLAVDLFRKKGNCWSRIQEFGLSELGANSSFGNYSIGYRDSKDFIELIWKLSRKNKN